jgi:hypothetical protein
MMLGGSPPRPALQPGVHGAGALPQQHATNLSARARDCWQGPTMAGPAPSSSVLSLLPSRARQGPSSPSMASDPLSFLLPARSSSMAHADPSPPFLGARKLSPTQSSSRPDPIRPTPARPELLCPKAGHPRLAVEFLEQPHLAAILPFFCVQLAIPPVAARWFPLLPEASPRSGRGRSHRRPSSSSVAGHSPRLHGHVQRAPFFPALSPARRNAAARSDHGSPLRRALSVLDILQQQ